MRVGHKLYIKWILNKYPEAAQFKWEKIGGKINDGNVKQFLQKVKRGAIPRLRKMLNLPQKVTPLGMNPMEYWYVNKPDIRTYMDGYFRDNVENSILDNEMKNRISDYYMTGTALEKTQALTVLGALKFYF